ncbi:MAG TPA: crotonase/enoyl-CoA hydratase family protein [Polyangiales bacterium]
MPYACFEIEIQDKVAELRLNRPTELNTMTRAFWAELPRALRELDARALARVVVLTSSGKHFTAGMDLSVFSGFSASAPTTTELGRLREALRRSVLELQDSFNALEQIRMPVLAAIQGGCIGGGVDMVSACDARYCTQDAFFCIQEINLGMVADVGTLQRLPRLIPSGMVRELAYTGRRLSAARAKEIGLVNEVYPDADALRSSVMQVAREIAEHSPLAVHGTKEVLNYARDHSVQDSLLYMAAWQSGMFQPADMKECLSARQEKRAPVFEDLAPIRKFDE